MRILHFSDIHLPLGWRSVPWRDWLSKRIIGGAHLLLGRAAQFADGQAKVVALDRFRQKIAADLVVFSGDYTALGTRPELRQARRVVEPLMQAPLGYADVPGNHDVYVFDGVRRKRWEATFGDTFETDLPQHVVPGGSWPFVRLLEDVAVVGVDSSRPNPLWRGSGKVPPPQLKALKRVLADEALHGRFVFVVTHYAPCLEDGGPDRRIHGLVNANEFLDICAGLERGAILCGHVHRRYVARIDGVKPPVFCAGSATRAGFEGLWIFDIDEGRVRATPGGWQDGCYALDQDAGFEF